MYATPDSFLSLMIACPDRRQVRFSYAAEAQAGALESSADDPADSLLQMVACADCRQVRFPGHSHDVLALAGA